MASGATLERACLLAVLLFSATGSATSADVERYLRSAETFYGSFEFERALEQLAHARKVAAGIEDDAAIDVMQGVVEAQLNRHAESDASFEAGLTLLPDSVLPLDVAPKLREHFEAIRARVKARGPPVPKPEPQLIPPSPEQLVAPAPAPSRLPGILLTAGGVVAAGVGAYLINDALQFNTQRLTLAFDPAAAARGRAQTEWAGGCVAVGAGTAAAVAGILLWARAGSAPSVSLLPTPGGLAFAVRGDL